MSWIIDYYSEEVRLEIEALPVGIRASYARLTNLLEEFGLDLRIPHSRAMGGGLFELRPKGREGIARVFYCMPACVGVVTPRSAVASETRQATSKSSPPSLRSVLPVCFAPG